MIGQKKANNKAVSDNFNKKKLLHIFSPTSFLREFRELVDLENHIQIKSVKKRSHFSS